jgi:hypothetical protein
MDDDWPSPSCRKKRACALSRRNGLDWPPKFQKVPKGSACVRKSAKRFHFHAGESSENGKTSQAQSLTGMHGEIGSFIPLRRPRRHAVRPVHILRFKCNCVRSGARDASGRGRCAEREAAPARHLPASAVLAFAVADARVDRARTSSVTRTRSRLAVSHAWPRPPGSGSSVVVAALGRVKAWSENENPQRSWLPAVVV